MCRNNQIWLIFLTLSCVALSARGSVSQVDTGTLRSLGLSRKEIKEVRSSEPIENVEEEEIMIEEDVDDDEEPWKSNEDWWKDPLAMFSDDDEEEMPQEEIDETVPIVAEATSLGGDIAVDGPDDEVVEDVQTGEALVEDQIIQADDALVTPEDDSVEMAASPQTIPTKAVKTESSSEPVVETKPSKPVQDTTAESRQGSKSSGSITSPLALLVPLFPKLQGALSNVPLTQLAASAVVVKFGIDTVKNKRLSKKEAADDENDEYSDAVEEEDEVSDDLEDDQVDLSEDDEEEIEEEDESPEEPSRPLNVNGAPRRHGRPGWIREVRDKFARTPSGERIPSARELYVQVQTLEKSLEKAKTERDALEQEYEKASFQVQEQDSEIKSLTTTTKYLKAQLRDNEEVQNKAIRAERRKAKEELARMKGAMVAILDKERKAMREELKRQTSELRGLLMEATDGDFVPSE